MFIIIIILFFNITLQGYCYDLIFYDNQDINVNLDQCVVKIVHDHYEIGSSITYTNFATKRYRILKALNHLTSFSVIVRTKQQHLPAVSNSGYVINVETDGDFLSHFKDLAEDPDWNPNAKFVIVVHNLNSLENIFHELLKAHVVDVIVINGNTQADIYTYNPYENYACGYYFERVISYGTCTTPTVKNFFPNKFGTGLRNCIINTAVSHLPPLVVRPQQCEIKNKEFCIGFEQYVFEMMSELKSFKINYMYYDFAQAFSTISPNMTAVGSFSLIQKNVSQVLFGFTFLSDTRAKAFSYVYEHLAYTDQLLFVVRKAGPAARWKYIYLEFSIAVWLTLFIAFIVSCVFAVILINPKDKARLVLNMWGAFFLRGFRIRSNLSPAKIFILSWIVFGFLINSFFASILLSYTVNPVTEFQISNEADLVKFKLKPCVPDALKIFITSFSGMNLETDTGECLFVNDAFLKVGNDDKIFSIVPKQVFDYNQPLMLDSDGHLKLYYFKDPMVKIIYGYFFYKGFPFTHELKTTALHLREYGFVDRYVKNVMYYGMLSTNRNISKVHTYRLIVWVPWSVLVIGTLLATFVFVLEILGSRLSQRTGQRI